MCSDDFSPGQLDPQAARAGRGGGGEQKPGGDHQQRGRGVQLRQQVVSPGEIRCLVSGGQSRLDQVLGIRWSVQVRSGAE